MTQELIDQISNCMLTVGIAGPGTGKTYTFKEIINSNEYKGKQILILSFINKLIDDLEKDFKDFPNVEVRTLHGFAKKQLGNINLFEMLDTIISADYFYIEGKSFNYRENLRRNRLHLPENSEAFEFYKKRKQFYEQKNKIYSFDSSIFAVNIVFTENEGRIPQYDLILIDEFQDFNELEFDLIKILNKKNRIVVVGDDDQSLYDFKYAEPNIIRNLYGDSNNAKFSLDFCRRCTEVIVNSANNLISESQKIGLLANRIDKRFLYPRGENREKDLLSDNINKIDFLPKLIGNKLIYELSNKINQDIGDGNKRVLILAPKYYHQFLYDGLRSKNFNVVDYELFADEKNGKIPHKIIIDALETLYKRKTDDLNLRLLLDLYLNEKEIKEILCENKRIWNCLTKDTKKQIEYDIKLFKKAKNGVEILSGEEIQRLNKLFNLKNLISKMLCGFEKTVSKSVEVEIVTPMSSKGLSAELVYYLFVDDKELFGKENELTDKKICEFLVSITRARERLTLISKEDIEPKILNFLGRANINTIETS